MADVTVDFRGFEELQKRIVPQWKKPNGKA